MSSFQKLRESCYLNDAEPLDMKGSTCEAFSVLNNGRKQFMKRLKQEYAGDPQYISLFTKEYTIGKRLTHPNLVRYNNMEVTSEGVLMFQDYISGETLTERLSNNPEYFRDMNNLRRFILQLLSCLSYLHSQQIVHLDLKPDNLMLTQIDDSLKVLDLGFCYTDSFCTLTGKSDGYAAPEQYADDTKDIDVRTDLFAVGRIIEQIEHLAFAPAKKKLPTEFRSLMHKCTQEDKQKRPASADECIGILKRGHLVRVCIPVAAIASLLLIMATKFGIPSGYDMSDRSGNRYKILSEEDLTCEVVGYKRVYDVDGPNLIIEPFAEHKGKRYKVVAVADDAFIGDTLIQSVYIPQGVKSIGDRALSRCKNIHSLSIPSSVEEIGEDCFSKDTILASISLPKGIKELKNNTFVDCHALSSITIPDGVTSIGKDCFTSCTSLTEVLLPASIKHIERGAFYNCTSLLSITIPADTESIGDYAFYDCTSLENVYNLSPVPQIISKIFNKEDITIHVPAGSAELYKNTPEWKNYSIVEYSVF